MKRADVDLSKSEQLKSARRWALELDTNCFSVIDNWCSAGDIGVQLELLAFNRSYWRSPRVIGVQPILPAIILFFSH
ncbi:hypothetical protein [Sporosarcina sp. NCCP-2222]|uniref:hypothetical protein n=1 Tax=Sporosarcina sp. NCCP-2222 TaxID=2935073 RepID=UPI0020BF0371|nr:hypothetical protein [Sporosarcina sp. NCCP-2222]